MEPTYTADTIVTMQRELTHAREQSGLLIEGWDEVLQWMDLCSAISSSKHAKSGMLVTAQVDDVRFLGPLIHGDMLTLTAMVTCSWNTSMEVELILEAENLLSESQPRHICTSYFTFVLLKGSGPEKLPPLIASNKEHQEKYLEASERRRIRFKRKELISFTSRMFQNSLEFEKTRNLGSEVKIKPISASAVCSSLIVLPPNANPAGNTFGGKIMGWMEETARLACKKHARTNMYLWDIDDIQFIKGSRVGDCLTIKAQVNRVFTDSLEVGVRVEAVSWGDTEVRHINSGYLTFGCTPPSKDSFAALLSEDSLSQSQLPLVEPTTERETIQFNNAIGRRRIRFERRAVSGCSVQFFTPAWSSELQADLIYSNIRNMTKVGLELPIPWIEVKSEAGIKVSMQTAEEYSLCKVEMELPAGHKQTAADIFPLFTEAALRRKWDNVFRDYRVVETIDEHNDIAHATFSSNGNNEITHDFCLLRSWRTPQPGDPNDSNLYIFSSRSVLHPAVPEIEGVKRGYVYPSGFIVSDLPNGAIRVLYVVQAGASAVQFALETPLVASTADNFKALRGLYTQSRL